MSTLAIGVLLILVGLPVLFAILPIHTISIPQDVMDFLLTGQISQVFNTLNYFVDIGFGFTCLIAILFFRYFHIILDLAKWIIRLLTSHG